MSWYSLIRDEAPVIRSFDNIEKILTGKIIGESVVKKWLKKNSIYHKSRETVGLYFIQKFCSSFNPRSADLSKKLLQRIVLGKSIPELFPELFQGIQGLAKRASEGELSLPPPESIICKLEHFVQNVFEHALVDGDVFSMWTEAWTQGEEYVETMIKEALIVKLEPLCAKVLKASFKSLVKVSIENGYDRLWMKGISVASVAGICKLSLEIFAEVARLNDGSSFKWTVELLHNNLPSPSQVLSVLTALHVGTMIKIFWKTAHAHPKRTDLNKDEIKALIIRLTKEPIKKALNEKAIYKLLHQAFSEERVDAFIAILIGGLIEQYWDELHEIQFMNLPLVT